MKCSLPPHHDTISFSTFEEFEIHYSKEHAHRCPECRKNFPTEHFLGLHISENHDPLTEARKAKGEKTVSLGSPSICETRNVVLISSNSMVVLLKTARKSARTPRNDECMYVLSGNISKQFRILLRVVFWKQVPCPQYLGDMLARAVAFFQEDTLTQPPK